jgi:uncharacterized protein YbaR (Trm112 family)
MKNNIKIGEIKMSPILFIKSKLGLIHRHKYEAVKTEICGIWFESMKCKECGYEILISESQYKKYCPPEWQYCSNKSFEMFAQEKDIKNDIKKLKNEQPVFGKKLTKDEYIRAVCVHKDKDGNFTLVDNHDGTVTCSICKQTYPIIEKENIKSIIIL